ncbi:MAG: hypothetical protein J3K34DRAFT_522009 [Monoraphidium minutum]|nr:MAG: hypothetical protein J3K34DRAFT_522009 [Monoraphidium minutum]
MAHAYGRLPHEAQQPLRSRGVASAACGGLDTGAVRRALRPAALLAHGRLLPRTAAAGAAAAAAAVACCAAPTAALAAGAHPQPHGWHPLPLRHLRARAPLRPGGGAGGCARRGVAAAAAPEVSTSEAGPQQQPAPGAGPQAGAADAGAAPEQQGGAQEGAEQEQEQQHQGGKARRSRYSPLHHNIEEFCRRVVPTRDERAAKQRVIDAVRACTQRGLDGVPLPEGARVKVQPFGSFVSGLSTWNSDVDIVISGLVTPSRLTGGFGQADKRFVTKVLDRVARELRRGHRIDLRSLVIIRTARIPIIKLQTGPQHGSVVADISLGDESGPAAARYVTQQIAAYPPLAPLVLVLKVYLRRCGLNEVSNGGLSSYSLTLMVLAHLQEEIKAGNDVFDLGEALYGFLLRYGEEFDYAGDAVSAASGGVVPKTALGFSSSSGSFDDDGGGGGGGNGWRARERLMVDDPLTGRDISAGTYRVDDLRLAFGRAARRLEALARGRRDGATNYLQGLFEVESALIRSARDLHGQHFPGEDPPPRGGARRRGGGGGGRGGPPREVVLTEEFDLGEITGDEMMWEEGGPYGGGDGRRGRR